MFRLFSLHLEKLYCVYFLMKYTNCEILSGKLEKSNKADSQLRYWWANFVVTDWVLLVVSAFLVFSSSLCFFQINFQELFPFKMRNTIWRVKILACIASFWNTHNLHVADLLLRRWNTPTQPKFSFTCCPMSCQSRVQPVASSPNQWWLL